MNCHLLDCTLRDGGYLNDWKFGQDHISYLFERQVSSGVDVIEVGFLDQRRAYDPARTIQPDTESYNKLLAGLDHGNAMVVAMIDYGTCDISHIQPCAETCLDGIRVIFKKHLMHEAVAFCKEIKALGYQVFTQAVSITSYNDDELRQLIALVNDCKPYAMSMVDTYGLLDADMLGHIISVIDAELDPEIMLGYHAHNNFQLGYANAVSMLNKQLNRDILVDGTLYGMGKSAGNAPVELIAMYMNSHLNKRYDISQMQEAIATCLLDLYKKQPWGYTLFYYIAASNHCHPDYVSYLMNKRTLSVSAVNEILQQIPEEEKLNKNMKLIEQLYLRYQATECDDTASLRALRQILSGRQVLMIGPGATIQTQAQRVQEFLQELQPVVISINYFPKLVKPDYLFLTNSRRYLQMASQLTNSEAKQVPIIATSNIKRTEGSFPYLINYSSLIDPQAEFPDNSMVMLLKLLRSIGVTEIALAGFDGYSADNINFFDKSMEYSFIKDKAESLNHYARTFLSEYCKDTKVCFITDSYYQAEG